MVNGQGLPVQLICHTKPYKNQNFQNDGTSRYFGVLWLWESVRLPALSSDILFLCLGPSFIGAAHTRDKGLLYGRVSCYGSKPLVESTSLYIRDPSDGFSACHSRQRHPVFGLIMDSIIHRVLSFGQFSVSMKKVQLSVISVVRQQSSVSSASQRVAVGTMNITPSMLIIMYVISLSSYNRYKLNSLLTYYQQGFIAQLL